MSDAVIVALIVGVFGVISVSISSVSLYFVARLNRQVAETHDLVNGMSHELQTAQKAQNRAEAFTEGEQAERDRGV
jgi:hypothetical protein